jgi:hypothetical protein
VNGKQGNPGPENISGEPENEPNDPIADALKSFLAFIRKTVLDADSGVRLGFVTNVVFNGLLVVTGVIAASIYGCQLNVMSGQLEQMKALQPKPFVAIDNNKFVGNIVFPGGYPTLDASYSVKNYGTAIAIDEMDGAVFLPDEDPEKTWRMFSQWCWDTQPDPDFSKTSPEQAEMMRSYGRTMIPPGMIIGGGQLQHRLPMFGYAQPRRILSFAAEVCISYRWEPSGKMHHTRYLYRGDWDMPPTEVTFDGWSYRQIKGFILERTDAD